jgi:hypothetical protein
MNQDKDYYKKHLTKGLNLGKMKEFKIEKSGTWTGLAVICFAELYNFETFLIDTYAD